jgi:hypothetical protein
MLVFAMGWRQPGATPQIAPVAVDEELATSDVHDVHSLYGARQFGLNGAALPFSERTTGPSNG